jgi:hypothetical protein
MDINNVDLKSQSSSPFQDPKVQLHVFGNSTLVNDEQIGLEVFVKQAAFSDLRVLDQ